MSFLRSGGRRTRVGRVVATVLSLAAFQVLAIVGAGPASAVTGCTYNPATDTINITLDPTESAGVMVDNANDVDPNAPAGSILFDNNGAGFGTDTACGSASNTNTVAIVVLGSPGTDEFFYIDENSGDPFNTAIAWHIDMGTNATPAPDGDDFEIDLNDDQDNTVVVTNTTFDLNGGVGEILGMESFFGVGGDGDDVFDASAVTSSVFVSLDGGAGDDWLAPGLFADPVGGGDEINGGADIDTVSYGTRTTCIVIDNNLVIGSGTDANCDGDATDTGDEGDQLLDFLEVLESGSGNDTLIGDAGTDETFVPGDGDDDITGNAGDDDVLDWSTSSAGMTIDPALGTATGQGTDTFTDVFQYIGSPSDDTLIWDGSTLFFDGGDGTDRVDASATTGGESIDLDELDGLPEDGTGAPADSVENVIGGTGNDDLEGNDLRNRIDAGEGDDFLFGDDGNDFLIGGAGNDEYEGGDGADKVSFKNSPAGVEADLLAGFATGEGDDSFTDAPEIVVGSGFNDSITGGGGTVASNFRFIGGNGKDLLTGSGSNDTLKGGGGRDTIRGVGGDDTLIGAAGNDRLFGGAGVDVGRGGAGQDTCAGVEIRSSCGKKGNPARGVAAKLARL
jgi:RTX calcium-binding nonapeptide repeat (4 copies)